MTEERNTMVVTPWEVSGRIDYERLIRQFGTQPITKPLLERVRSHTGDLHLQLRRGIVFSHRDFDWILDKYEAGEQFYLYTGRGPSGHVHLGHMLPWFFTKYLQDKFDATLYFQMTDDEKFLVRPLSLRETWGFTVDNALDIMAVGLDPKKTMIIPDTRCIRTIYTTALRVAKHVTYSTARAVFGFEDSSNIGIVFFPAIQAVPCFLDSVLHGRNAPCLIPASIDQDPYWRVTRDVAPKLGFYKPAQTHGKFLPGLIKGGKMSASIPESAIFTMDNEVAAVKKIMDAFTGGQPTIEEQRRYGGNPDICPVYYYTYYLFEEDDRKAEETRKSCETGRLLCGEHKMILAERVKRFLAEHQARREKAKDIINDVLVDDEYFSRLLKK
ncbi:MAG: tryptophan--tRNA ligase [Candidatus Bathyarchaeia archaeon]